MLTRAQQRLVVQHLDLVPRVASVLLSARGKAAPIRDELEGYGYVALVEAASRYRPQRGGFRDFARFRIRGAMLDEIRKRDVLGRHYREALKHGGRVPGRALARELVVGEAAEKALKVLPSPVESPEDAAGRTMLRGRLLAALATLNDQERETVASVLRGDPLKEIGARWGRSEARACQVWIAALEKMRSLTSGLG